MNYGCENLIVVITGGTSGIGKACTEILAKEGAKVFVLARHKKIVRGAEFVFCDVTSRQDVQNALAKIKKQVQKIDIVINSAGIYSEQRVEKITDAEYKKIMDTNLLGTMLVCQYALPLMQNGSIINVASDAALHGNYGCALYSASKGAVVAFSKSLALDVAPNIRVNCVCPADVDTPLTRKQCKKGHYTLEDCKKNYPLQKIASADEIAHVICSVASPRNSFMTRSVIMVDGGIAV